MDSFEGTIIFNNEIEYPWDYELPELPDKLDPKDHCDHLWVKHHGLIEIFDYCKYCDERKDDTNN